MTKQVLEKIRSEIEKASYDHTFQLGEYYHEEEETRKIVNLDTINEIFDKYKENEVDE